MATTSTLNAEIASRVQALRDTTGISVRELAVQSGIPERTLHRLLHGKADWLVTGHVQRLADTFGIDWQDLTPEAIR